MTFPFESTSKATSATGAAENPFFLALARAKNKGVFGGVVTTGDGALGHGAVVIWAEDTSGGKSQTMRDSSDRPNA